jgi:hypothetical protein
MAHTPEQEPPTGESVAKFFHRQVRVLLSINGPLVLGAERDELTVRVLHLIDAHPQPGTPIDYHYVYTATNTQTSKLSHGVFLANPWPRTWSRREHYPPKESRHYFDGGQDLIVREDSRRTHREFEFLRGPVFTDNIEDPELALAVESLHSDLSRVAESTPLKPERLVFDNFVRIK